MLLDSLLLMLTIDVHERKTPLFFYIYQSLFCFFLVSDKLPTLKIVDLPFHYPRRERVKCVGGFNVSSKTISRSKGARNCFSNCIPNDGWIPPISVLRYWANLDFLYMCLWEDRHRAAFCKKASPPGLCKIFFHSTHLVNRTGQAVSAHVCNYAEARQNSCAGFAFCMASNVCFPLCAFQFRKESFPRSELQNGISVSPLPTNKFHLLEATWEGEWIQWIVWKGRSKGRDM